MWLHLGIAEFMNQFCGIDLISRIIMSGAYLIYYLMEESQIGCMATSLDADVQLPFVGHCDLDLCSCF